MRRSWSKDAVVSELRLRKQRHLSLERSVVEAEDRSLLWASERYFGKGGYFKALKKIGVNLERKQKSWSAKKVIAAIRKIHRTDKKLNSNFIQTHHGGVYQIALHYFGSWGNAIAAAGFEYSKMRVRAPFKKWSQAAILAEMKKKKRSKALHRGSIPTTADRRLYQAAKRYFGKGGWKKALNLIGLKPLASPVKIRWTKTLVKKEIRELLKTREKLPSTLLEKHGYWALIKYARKLFGSWREAIIAAGVDYELVRTPKWMKWPKKRVVEEIRHLDSLGVRLNHASINATRRDLLSAGVSRFGSWSQAVEAAGIDYHQHALIWSSKAWVRKLTNSDVKILQKKAQSLARKRSKK